MPISALKRIAIDETKISVGWRQRSCIVVRDQPSILEVVEGIIENDMAVCATDSKGIDRDPA
jgi:hypothetical protein